MDTNGRKTGLTGIDWARIGISILLVALSAFCALQSVMSGMAYGAGGGSRYGGPNCGIATPWPKISFGLPLLQGLTTLVLGPALRTRAGTPDNSYDLGKWGRYLIAFIISIFGTAIAFAAMFFIWF